jgi:hypothetical protein
MYWLSERERLHALWKGPLGKEAVPEVTPLVVFPDASEFDETTMQKIARELNLAETAFVLPATREDSMDRIPPHLLSGAH